MSEYFPKPNSLGTNLKVELDLPNFATKADLKNATGIDTLDFCDKKIIQLILKSDVDKLDNDKLENVPNNLSNLKSKVDKLDIDKLVPVRIDLSKQSGVVKNDVKKDVYNAKIKTIEDKITDITNIATNNTLSTKINEVKNEKHLVLLTQLQLLLLMLK